DDRVRGARRSVREDVCLREQPGDGEAELRRELLEGVLDALEGPLEVGRRLRQMQAALFVRDHDVGERSAGVDGDPEAHQAVTACDWTSASAARTISSTLVSTASSSRMLAGSGRSGIASRDASTGPASAAAATTSAA